MSKQELVQVKPRGGVILAGIPASGAWVTRELADEWERNGLVIKVKPDPPAPKGAK